MEKDLRLVNRLEELDCPKFEPWEIELHKIMEIPKAARGTIKTIPIS